MLLAAFVPATALVKRLPGVTLAVTGTVRGAAVMRRVSMTVCAVRPATVTVRVSTYVPAASPAVLRLQASVPLPVPLPVVSVVHAFRLVALHAVVLLLVPERVTVA